MAEIGLEREPQAVKQPEKRIFLKLLPWAITAAALGVTYMASRLGGKTLPPQDVPNPSEARVNLVKEKERADKLNKILALSLNSKERAILEKEFVTSSSGLGDIDLGLTVIVDENSRILLMDKRYQLRSKDNPDFQPLTDAELKWAKDNNMHPETLAITIEARNYLVNILSTYITKEGIEKFRPDILEKIKRSELPPSTLRTLKENPELMLISAGGMAELLRYETGKGIPDPSKVGLNPAKVLDHEWLWYGWASVGHTPAVEQTLDSAFSKIKSDAAINTLTLFLKEKTNLDFKTENIPGSTKDADSETGGAIGIQLMPSNAEALIRKYARSAAGDFILHPSHPIGGLILAYLYLAEGGVVGKDIQAGYIAMSLNQRGADISDAYNLEALQTWNYDMNQAQKIQKADLSYRQAVPNK